MDTRKLFCSVVDDNFMNCIKSLDTLLVIVLWYMCNMFMFIDTYYNTDWDKLHVRKHITQILSQPIIFLIVRTHEENHKHFKALLLNSGLSY